MLATPATSRMCQLQTLPENYEEIQLPESQGLHSQQAAQEALDAAASSVDASDIVDQQEDEAGPIRFVSGASPISWYVCMGVCVCCWQSMP